MYGVFLPLRRSVHARMYDAFRPVEKARFFASNGDFHVSSDKKKRQNHEGTSFSRMADGFQNMGKSFKDLACKMRNMKFDMEVSNRGIQTQNSRLNENKKPLTPEQQFEDSKYTFYTFYTWMLFASSLVAIIGGSGILWWNQNDPVNYIVQKTTSKDKLLAIVGKEIFRVKANLDNSASSYRIVGFFGLSRGSAHEDKLCALEALQYEIMNSKDSGFKCSFGTRRRLIDAYNYWPEEEDKLFKKNFIDVYLNGNTENSKLAPRR